jgi:hypothetical protein
MIAGTPARSIGLVYQKLAPLVREAFSSRVSSLTSGMVTGAGVVFTSVISAAFSSGGKVRRMPRHP